MLFDVAVIGKFCVPVCYLLHRLSRHICPVFPLQALSGDFLHVLAVRHVSARPWTASPGFVLLSGREVRILVHSRALLSLNASAL